MDSYNLASAKSVPLPQHLRKNYRYVQSLMTVRLATRSLCHSHQRLAQVPTARAKAASGQREIASLLIRI